MKHQLLEEAATFLLVTQIWPNFEGDSPATLHPRSVGGCGHPPPVPEPPAAPATSLGAQPACSSALRGNGATLSARSSAPCSSCSDPSDSEPWDLVCGFTALVFPHHCIRRNPNLTDENGKVPTRSQCGQNLALTACCANGRSAANSTRKRTHPWALLTAGSCREELVFAMLGTLPEASLVQTMVKSLGSRGEIPPNEFFPVVRYYFFSLADIRTISFANTCTSLQRKAWTYP